MKKTIKYSGKFCNKECKEVGPICDFCRFYNFNSDIDGAYIDKGYCTLFNERKEPEDGCKWFICVNYKKLESSLDHDSRETDIVCRYYSKYYIKLAVCCFIIGMIIGVWLISEIMLLF